VAGTPASYSALQASALEPVVAFPVVLGLQAYGRSWDETLVLRNISVSLEKNGKAAKKKATNEGGSLPLLHLPGASRPPLDGDLVFRQHWDCVKCAPADVMALRQREVSRATGDIPLCIALPLEVFPAEQALGKSAFLDIQTWISDLRPGIVTTVGDVPITTDRKHLIKVFEEVRRAV